MGNGADVDRGQSLEQYDKDGRGAVRALIRIVFPVTIIVVATILGIITR